MLTNKQAAFAMGVSLRSVYLARELQRCSPQLADAAARGDMTIRAALRIAKPEKYGKRDKVQQWLDSFKAWDTSTRERAIVALAAEIGGAPDA